MHSSIPTPAQPGSSAHTRCRAVFFAAAAPLVLASAAWSQLPAPAPRLMTPGPQANPTLPPAQPTQNQPAAALAPAPAPHEYRPSVQFSGNQLTVTAENSSLNEILGEIARLTGLKITGGVTDERVYGSYGPDSAQAVLNQLLDGTGVNVMLLETSQHTLAELVLTPRNGGPTPPSPSASREDDRNEENLPPGLSGRRRDLPPGGRHGRIDTVFTQENRGGELPPGAQQQQPAASNEATPPPDATQQSPNGVKTYQQIYDELNKNPQDQQQPTQPAPTTPQ